MKNGCDAGAFLKWNEVQKDTKGRDWTMDELFSEINEIKGGKFEKKKSRKRIKKGRPGRKKGKSGKAIKKERKISQKTVFFTGTVQSGVIYSRM